MATRIISACLVVLASGSLLAATAIPRFSELQSLDGSAWRPLEFRKIHRHSHYALSRVDGTAVVRADTDNSASGLIVRRHIDPRATPVIEWRWKISNTYAKGDAMQKQGDDYPARIYVAFAFEPERAGFFEKAGRAAASVFYKDEIPGSALNYIWANKLARGSIVANAWSDKTRMIAVDSSADQAGAWVTHRRNIIEDYEQAFGHPPPEIVGIGIMSDSDNTGESATAWYGDIVLTAGD